MSTRHGRYYPWQVEPTTLSQPDAQQRMYVLSDWLVGLNEQIRGLNDLRDKIYGERASLLAAYSGLDLLPKKESTSTKK